MKSQIQKRQHIIDAEIIESWDKPDRVSLTRAELRNIQADAWGWRTLRLCGAALCVLVPLWLMGMTLKQEPAVLPRCESNCNVKQGWF